MTRNTNEVAYIISYARWQKKSGRIFVRDEYEDRKVYESNAKCV